MQSALGVVILAAGSGTRMKSNTHKVLHPVAGLPMIGLVLRAANSLSPNNTVVVVGHDADQVRSYLGDSVNYALQDPPLGTGDAVRKARSGLSDSTDTVLVLYGDTPLVQPDTLRKLCSTHTASGALVTMLLGKTQDPGRVLLDERGRVTGVVEEKLATPEQLRIPLRNSGVCAFSAQWLWDQLETLQMSTAGEYYLTDLIGKAVSEGERDGRWPVAWVEVDRPWESMGINNRVQLAEANRILREVILEELMMSGVTIADLSSTYVDLGVEVGPDTTLLPGTHLTGRTCIGAGSTIGPYTVIQDSHIGDNCRVRMSTVEESYIGSGSDAGPYCHLRPGSRVESGVHLGNFVETKNTRIGSGSASGHFSYLGDATIGENVNIGAGTITCNFDGVKKNPTIIHDKAFIGSDTMLIAPVVVGEGARTGAGSVVTRDVPEDRTVVGIPARLVPGQRAGKKPDVEGRQVD